MTLRKRLSLREALERPDLLGNALPGESWLPHRALLIAAMGEELRDEEREIFHTITGRDREPMQQCDELVAIIGRRGGKTRSAGTLAAYVSTLCHHDYAAAGERPVIPILAGSTVQANASFQAVLGVLQESKILSKQIESSNTEVIRMKSKCDIAVRPASFRTIRGITSPLICADEVSTWHNDEHSSNADVEILNAARPALATTGGLLYMYSSPWSKRGELWTAFKDNYGADGDPAVIVARAASKVFNKTLPQRVIDRAYAKDAFRAAAEYGAEFRDGISNLLDPATVEAATDQGIMERPPLDSVQYVAHADVASGSNRGDSFTLAIAHFERGVAVIDAVRERQAPFNPDAVTAEYADLLRRYRLHSVQIDRYAAGLNSEMWKRVGITPRLAPKTTSEMYASLVPAMNSGQVALVDHARLRTQLIRLERRSGMRGGREIIDHAPGEHDDIAAAVSGAVHLAIVRPTFTETFASPEVIF